MIDWGVLFGVFCAGVSCCTVGGMRVAYWYRHERIVPPSACAGSQSKFACAGSQSGDAPLRKRSRPEKLTEEMRQQLEAAFLAQEAADCLTAGGGAPGLALPPGVTLNDVLFPPFTLKERLVLLLGWEQDKALGRRYHHATWLARQILASCQASRLHTPGRPNALPPVTVFVPDGPEADALDYTFCLEPPVGVRVSRFNNEFLEDLNTRLGGFKATVTFCAPGVWLAVPQERVVTKPAACSLADLGSPPESYRLPLPLGRGARGPLWADLATAPHALVAGATGSGKSTLIHACLYFLLDRAEVWGLDLKMVELSRYKRRMARLVTEPDEVTGLLAALFQETRRRLAAMQQQGDNAWRGTPIVLVVDELAEVTLASRDDTQILLRLAQIGRAAGVHLLLATQRPSVQIIPGDLKANIPLRVALALPTGVDSRVVLDLEGAETLRPPGDALVLQGHRLTRVSTPNFRAPAPPLDLDGEDDPRLVGLSADARAVFVRIQEAGGMMQEGGGRRQGAGGRISYRAVKALMHWGDRRALRALRELRMAGLLEGEPEVETEEEEEAGAETAAETAPDLYPPMLPRVTVPGCEPVASAVAAAGAVASKNREQNGQGVQFADRETFGETSGNDFWETRETFITIDHAAWNAGAADAAAADADASDAAAADAATTDAAARDADAVQQAIRDGACAASVRSVRAHFGWRTARAARALRVLRGMQVVDGRRGCGQTPA